MQNRSKLELDYTPSRWPFLLSQALNGSMLLLAWFFKLPILWLLALFILSALFAYITWQKLSHSEVKQLSHNSDLWYLTLTNNPQRQQADLWQVKHISSKTFLLVFRITQQNQRKQTLYFANDNASESELRAINRLLYAGQF